MIKTKDLMVVGIGASAGGLNVLSQFFERMPVDSDLVFVIILHLSPEYKSNIVELLQRKTSIPIAQVNDAVKVEPNHAYVIPPEKNLVMMDGYIHLKDRNERGERQLPINLFFRTLADAYQHRAVAVVLSGTGTDGSLGVKNIKEVGGISIAQDPAEAEYDGMPRSSIESGAIDFILPIVAIPEKLVLLKQNAMRLQMSVPKKIKNDKEEGALREVLTLLRTLTRHDFVDYKPSTLRRRIERRLQVTESNDIFTYLEYVRSHPLELQGLLSDLLISVTNFFRDPETFSALANEVIPKLFVNKGSNDQVRVWVVGCATGEEAYSLAILLNEYAEHINNPPRIQIFATDINDEAITNARKGVFLETIVTDVSPERLNRFFVKEEQYYRVKGEIREMVLFASHNILSDPPFSKLDLVSCRNLLIYLNRQMQDRVLEIFHFALRSGYLFLGSSESADNLPTLFSSLDKKNRIYQRQSTNISFKAAPLLPVGSKVEAKLLTSPLATSLTENFSFGELHYKMLELFAPPSVLVNNEYEIVHLSEHAGRYLRFTGGEPSRNLLKVAHPDLRLDLRSLLLTATQESGEAHIRNVLANFEGELHLINISVCPIESAYKSQGFLLVLFDEYKKPMLSSNVATSRESTNQEEDGEHKKIIIRQLEEELQRTKDQLRSVIEQYEILVEELKASNEELQAMNEEMHAAAEELETSREELQSVNEELTTLNHELKEKIEEISRTNSDLQNLMASTDIGTLFLDRSLCIKRYTPYVQELFNIIPGDINRPLTHLTHKLDYKKLTEDAEKVLVNLQTIENEISTIDGRWFIVRMLPYRTIEDKINGLIITFVDITKHKQAKEALQESETRMRLATEAAQVFAWDVDLTTQKIKYSENVDQIFGYKSLPNNFFSLQTIPLLVHEDDQNHLSQLIKQTMNGSESVSGEYRVTGANGFIWIQSYGNLVCNAQGLPTRLSGVAQNITRRKQAEEALQKTWEELEERVQERTSELAKTNKALKEEVDERRRIERERMQLLHRIVSMQEDERRSFSRELHDQLGQCLTALRLKIEGIREQHEEHVELCSQLEQLQKIAQQLDSDVNFLAWKLRPSILDDLGLIAALSNYVQEWTKHLDIPVNFHTTGFGEQRLSQIIETNFYRIAQEALNNISKHAEATSVDIILERRDENVILLIEDNGRGFDPEQVISSQSSKGMGLIGMRERAALIGGTVEVESTLGEGTTIFVCTPLEFEFKKREV